MVSIECPDINKQTKNPPQTTTTKQLYNVYSGKKTGTGCGKCKKKKIKIKQFRQFVGGKKISDGTNFRTTNSINKYQFQ